ncbi:MAG: hypothetical protein WBE26_09250 [Phycisphaerae bacterium]
MKKHTGYVLLAGFLPLVSLAGCDALSDILLPSTVMVSLVNESPDYDVEVTLFYHDEDDIPEIVLTEIGTERNYTIKPGETVSFTRDCDDLQAIIIEDAELQTGLFRPDTHSGVLRIDENFECGQEIVFTFTHSDVLLDLDFGVLPTVRWRAVNSE